MSVVVSSAGVGVGGGGRMAGTGGGTPCKTNITTHTPQQEGEEEEESGGGGGGGGCGDDIDGWRQAVRAKVTTLKCHVMASCGLTSDGHIVAPYSPRLLLDSPNSRLLLDAASLDLDAYVEALHRADGLLAKNGACGGSGDGGTNGDGNNAGGGGGDDVSLGDVQLRLQQEGLTNGHTSPSATSPAKSTPNGSTTPKSPPPSPAPSPTPTFAKVVEVNGHTLNGHHPHHHSSRDAVNGSPSPPPSGEEGGVDGEGVRLELAKVKRQLKDKEAEVLRLGRIRDEVENELQELTANLFQEAHSMVNSANQRAANAERSLREAEMQVEVLQAEVTALKALVITSTPAAPNPHLHPQLISKSVAETGKKIFQRGHRKSPSDFDLKYGRDTTPPSSPLKESRINDAAALAQFPLDPECWEVDPVVHKEFIVWKQNPTLERSNPFMQRIYEEDIDLCLAFPNSTLAHRVQRAIEDNSVFIEEVNPRQKSSCPRKCVLLDVPRFCKYRFRLSESDDTWYYISQLARNRIIAICDFLNYLRYIKLGLVKSSVHDVYWEIVKLRRQMALARLGF